MSLSSKDLSSIQKAGQAAHDASEAIAANVRTQAEGMVSSMASAPFSAESEQAISRFKALSKLSQGLAAIEAELRTLYAIAADLANPASDVIVLKPVSRRKAISNGAAVDVVSRPAKTAKKAKKSGPKAATLTANDNKLLTFLQRVLKSGKTLSITGNEMSDGSGMPLGSVGLSLQKILAVGAVKRVDRGTYQLGAAVVAPVAAPVAETVVKAAPAKKVKPAVAKGVKETKAVATVEEEVKVKPAKKEKAAPSRKAKAPAAKKAKAATAPAPAAPVVKAPAVEAEAAPV